MTLSVIVQELDAVVRRYVFPQRAWSSHDTKIKLENHIISDKRELCESRRNVEKNTKTNFTTLG
jgi:hypothetical protein